MNKDSSIIIHQLRKAIDMDKQLNVVWRNLSDLQEEDREKTLEDLDEYRQQLAADGEETLSRKLNELITNVRIGIAPARPRMGPKEF